MHINREVCKIHNLLSYILCDIGQCVKHKCLWSYDGIGAGKGGLMRTEKSGAWDQPCSALRYAILKLIP